jgi:uncharacterized membrane protein
MVSLRRSVPMMNDYHDGWQHMGAWGWMGPFAMSVVWVLLVCVAFLLVQHYRGPRSERPAATSEAENIARERFARGDIDEGTFRALMQTLRETSP